MSRGLVPQHGGAASRHGGPQQGWCGRCCGFRALHVREAMSQDSSVGGRVGDVGGCELGAAGAGEGARASWERGLRERLHELGGLSRVSAGVCAGASPPLSRGHSRPGLDSGPRRGWEPLCAFSTFEPKALGGDSVLGAALSHPSLLCTECCTLDPALSWPVTRRASPDLTKPQFARLRTGDSDRPL